MLMVMAMAFQRTTSYVPTCPAHSGRCCVAASRWIVFDRCGSRAVAFLLSVSQVLVWNHISFLALFASGRINDLIRVLCCQLNHL